MKTNIKILITLCLLALQFFAVSFTFGQAPKKFNYQGIARDTKGNPLANQQLNIKLTILPTSDASNGEYEETQLVTTNEFGLYTLQIGNGTAVSGDLKTVKWETGLKYIKVAVDPQGGDHYTVIGTSQLLSVPYAMYADAAGVAYENTTGESHGGTRSTALPNYIEKTDASGHNQQSVIYEEPGTGHLGIGTITPFSTGMVHIKSPATGTQPLILEGALNSGVHCLFREGGINRGYFGSYIGSFPGPITGTSDADFDLGTSGASSGKLHLATQTQPRLSITPGGLVGIGTVNPTQRLHVVGREGVRIERYEAPGTAGANQTNALLINMTSSAYGSVASFPAGTINYISQNLTPGAHADLTFSANQSHPQLIVKNNGNVGIGTDNIAPAAKLDVHGNIQINDGTAAVGSVLTSTNVNGLAVWAAPSATSSGDWHLNGNAATSTDFLGTTNNNPLNFKVFNVPSGIIDHNNSNAYYGYRAGQFTAPTASSGKRNTAQGQLALYTNVTGDDNTAIGNEALRDATANKNTAVGSGAMRDNSTGSANTAIGYAALVHNLTGLYNTASGNASMGNNLSGIHNTANGSGALSVNQTGDDNTAIGFEAMGSLSGTNITNNTAVGSSALRSNQVDANTATGYQALYSNTFGERNTANGFRSLHDNIGVAGNVEGHDNTASGFRSLMKNTTGYSNTAFGSDALVNNLTGKVNTAIGYNTLSSNTTGEQNVAIGINTLSYNISGSENVATGMNALLHNEANWNTAMGHAALQMNTTGSANAAFGIGALDFNVTGSNNTASGANALFLNSTGNENASFGYYAMLYNNGDCNTAIGSNAFITNPGATYSNSTAIGCNSIMNANDKIRLGNSSVSVIEGQVAYSFPSDGRFKYNVKEEVKGLDFITQLRPVNYQFDSKKFDEFLSKDMPDSVKVQQFKNRNYANSMNIVHTGFIAQEVEAAAKKSGYNFDGVNVPKDANGNYSVAYSQFVVPLVKAVQEQQQIINTEKDKNVQLIAEVNTLVEQQKTLEARLKLLEEKLK